jgi:hypothetical protein
MPSSPFFGIKIAISQTDEDTLDALETRTEPRLHAGNMVCMCTGAA